MNSTSPENFKQVKLSLRIIWLALMMGVVTFGGVVVMIVQNQDQADPGEPVKVELGIYIVWIAFTVFNVVASLLIRRLFLAKAQRPIPLQRFVAANIISWALCEAPAFLSLVLCLIPNELFPFVYGAAAALAVMIFSPPKTSLLDDPGSSDTMPLPPSS